MRNDWLLAIHGIVKEVEAEKARPASGSTPLPNGRREVRINTRELD